MKGGFLLLLCFIGQMAASIDRCELEKIASKYHDTKGESHDYLVIYDEYFSPKRNEPLTLLEIGFAEGASARMWEEYFPKAQLHYIEISDFRQFAIGLSQRSHLHIGDQGDERFLAKVVKQVGEFDIIIDDASHQVEDQITSLEFLFPYVKSGGVYVIEDLHTSYWQHFGGRGDPGHPKSSPRSTTEYLKKLVDSVNYVGAYTGCARRELAKQRVETGVDKHGTYNYPNDFFERLDIWKRDIKSIHFYDSICFIFKR